MASLEDLTIAQQAVSILGNVRRDVLAEANKLKARLDANEWTAAYVATTANGVGTQLVASLQRIATHQSAVETALTNWSVSVPDTTADYQELRSAAEAMRDATPTNISATLTQIIAQVPEAARLF